MIRALAVVGVLALLPLEARAECVAYGLAVKVATPSSTSLPVDGGIVVYTEPVQFGRLDRGDPALVPDWKWKGSAKPVVKALAPGLAVVLAPSTQGTAQLVDGKGTAQVSIKTSQARRARLDAPVPKAIVHARRQTRRGGEDVMVELATPAPVGAVAIVLLDEASQPKSWQLLTDPSATLVPAYAVGGCVPLPNGTRATAPGERVRVAFVDDAGRMSPPSKPIKVVSKPSPPPP